jgi:tRNA (cytidine/uridine-2'-O-)-methyltransferase
MTPSTKVSWMPLSLEADPEVAVVLVEPRIPQNTGNIARLCACTGASLYLIGSLGFRLNDKYLSRAGMDYLDDVPITHLDSFEALLAEKPGWTAWYASTKASQSYSQVAYPKKSLLVFGSESHGLPAWLIEENRSQSVRIPMRDNTRSLNLSNSVAIVLYEVIRQQFIT